MAFSRNFLILVSVLMGIAGPLRAATEPRTALPESIRAIDPVRVRAVQPLRKEHLARELEFQISLRMRNFPKLLARMAGGERISRLEMEARYLPLPADYQAVVAWAKREGLTITRADPMRLGLFVKGSVAQIQTATRAQFAEVTVKEGTFTSAVTAPSVPAEFGSAVLGVNGLQPEIHPHRVASGLKPQIENAPPYLVSEIMGAYGAANLGYNGAGETIAILIDTFPATSDLTSFWSTNGIPQSLSNITEVQAVAGTLDPVSGEETLDTEWTSGIASGAKIRIYATTELSFTDLDEGLERIISDLPNTPSMHELSISLGLGETEVSASQKQTDSQYFATIANYGVSIFVASGDDGAVMDGTLQPSYYASDPSVTGVGGTSLTLQSSGAVETETAWDGSGGGVSSFYQRPSWQTGNGLPAGTMRVVPDVACPADPDTGAYVFLDGYGQQIGGTSWAAPAWAGFCALINEARTKAGLGPIGLLNPKIYPLIGSSSFRDITSGANGGYSAGVGYDCVTGIGTPMMSALLAVLTGSGAAPRISSFSPAVGAVGTTVAIAGISLGQVTGVKFNGTPASQFTVNSAQSISATVPSGAVTGPIEVVTGTVSTSSTTSFTVVPLPRNDNFANATLISGTAGQTAGSNIGATSESGEPAVVGGSPSGASVWWKWTAPANGTYTFSTAGSSFDTTEGVYTGTAVNNLTTIAGNDDCGTSVTSSVTFTATAGTVYSIAVGGYNSAMGAIVLTWEKNAAGPVITNFTPQSGSPGTVLTVTGSGFLGTSAVTIGGVAAGFSVISDSQMTVAVPSEAETGPISVTGAIGSALSGANFVVIAPVSNDNFANATSISGPSGTITGNNTGATKQPGEPDIAGNAGGRSIWYAWIPAFSGPVTFTTFGSSFETLLGVYTGANVAGLTLVASNDNYDNSDASSVTFAATAGTVYYIAVDGYDAASGSVVLNWSKDTSLPVITGFNPASGPVGTSLTITGSNFTAATAAGVGTSALTYTVVSDSEIVATVPVGASTGLVSVGNLLGTVSSTNAFTVTAASSNDDFVNGIPLSGAAVNVTGANVGATLEKGEPEIAGNAGGASVWWTWTAPASGEYAVSTLGSNFDTLLGVYTGSAVNQLTQVAANDDDPSGGLTSYVTFSATAGTAYHIAVDGYNGATGSILLNIYPQQAGTGLYTTGFEPKQGFTANEPLEGQQGWNVVNGDGTPEAGGNEVVSGVDGMNGQQAYMGYSAPQEAGDNTVLAYHPVDYSPVGTSEPIVTFSVTMAVNDSTNSSYDDFQWRLYNSTGHKFFTIDFDNDNLAVRYSLDGGTYLPTGVHFIDDTAIKLVVTMDYAHNRWSATLGGETLVKNQPIRTGSATLDFGSMDAVWQIDDPAAPGNNYMVFDDYSVVADQNPAPRIISQPLGQSVTEGNPVTLAVGATGAAPLYYQWMFNGKAVPVGDGASLTIPAAEAFNAGTYSVEVTNSVGLITSAPAVLKVMRQMTVPVITQEPIGMTVAAGSTAAFKAAASGYPAPVFQWLFNGTPIAGAKTATLNVHNAQAANAGSYTVVASNAMGSGTSTAAPLLVGSSFQSQAGNFNGMIYDGPADATGSGVLKVTMSGAGSFTGCVMLGGTTYRMAGVFNSQGAWQGTVGKMDGLPVTVHLQLSLAGTSEISGVILIGAATETGTALRDNYSISATAAPEMPAYTMTLTGTAAGLPEGTGYAAITVDKAGNVRATGRLADNTAFSVSGVVSNSGAWPFYAALYDSKGYIGGSLTFAGSNLGGALNWVAPGFSGGLTATGYAYSAPAKGAAALPLNGENQGVITFSGGPLSSPIQGQLSLGTANALTVSGTSGIKLTVTPGTGVFSGTVEAGFAKPLPFYGVLLQGMDEGSGYFQGAASSGQVEISVP